MTILKQISPSSAFKIGFAINAILGLLGGILCSVVAFAAITPRLHSHMPFLHGFGAALPLVLCPVLYGILGGIATAISALIYNVASHWVGGLEVDIG